MPAFSIIASVVVDHRERGRRHRAHADLTRLEAPDPGRPLLVLRAGLRDAVGIELAVDREGVLDLLGIERGRGAVGVHDIAARGPDRRPDREHAATAAVTTQRGSVDVAAERLDLLGVLGQLLESGRAFLRIETRLGIEILVPEDHREIDRVWNGVFLALIGPQLDVRGREAVLERQRIDP
jgi:hypothetical protein